MKKIYATLLNITAKRVSLPLILSHTNTDSARPSLLTKNVLLYGNSGCGKSTMLRAIADEFLNSNGIISSVNLSVYGYTQTPSSLNELSSIKEKSGLDLKLFKNVTEPIRDYAKKLAEGLVAFSDSLTNRMIVDEMILEEALLTVWRKSGESASLFNLLCELRRQTSNPIKLFVKELESKNSEIIYTKNKVGTLINVDTQELSPVITYLWIQSEINRLRLQPFKEKLLILDEFSIALPVRGNNMLARLNSIRALLESAKNYNIYVITSMQLVGELLPLVPYLPTIVMFKGRYPEIKNQVLNDMLDPSAYNKQATVTELVVSNQLNSFKKLRVKIK